MPLLHRALSENDGGGTERTPKNPSWVRFKNSLKLSMMNWGYFPRSNGSEETFSDKMLRFSHFPIATQLFSYFAYKGACQRLFGVFFASNVLTHYFLQDFNYCHTPMYKPKSSGNQIALQLTESAVLATISTLIIRNLTRFRRQKFGWHCIAFSSLAVPAVIGLVWARRFSLRDGTIVFANDGTIQSNHKRAALVATAETASTRALMSFANLSMPLLIMKFFEKKMVFFTPLKGLLFAELTLACGLALTPIALAAVYPIGHVMKPSWQFQHEEKSVENNEEKNDINGSETDEVNGKSTTVTAATNKAAKSVAIIETTSQSKTSTTNAIKSTATTTPTATATATTTATIVKPTTLKTPSAQQQQQQQQPGKEIHSADDNLISKNINNSSDSENTPQTISAPKKKGLFSKVFEVEVISIQDIPKKPGILDFDKKPEIAPKIERKGEEYAEVPEDAIQTEYREGVSVDVGISRVYVPKVEDNYYYFYRGM